MKKVLILPGCDDENRGDQALIWETKELAEQAGYVGKYYMLASDDGSRQSKKKNINNILPVLSHPSEHFKKNDNVKYTVLLKIKWGIAAISDVIRYEVLLHAPLRKILLPLYKKQIKESLRLFAEADAGFVKGGGFLHAYGGFADTYKIYYFLFHIRMALSYGKPVYIMPNSFGPFCSPFVKGMVRRTLKKCKVVMSRENISQDMLKRDCNVECYNFCDIAFYLQKAENFDVQGLLRKYEIPIDSEKCVAITARPYRFENESFADEKYKKYKEAIAESCIWLSQNGYVPVFVRHVASKQKHEDDLTCIKEIAELINGKCRYYIFSDMTLNCQEMKAVYGCFDAIIGTRFHSVIFSLSQNVPAVAISYGGNKGNGIMKDMEMTDYCIPISEISSEKLISTTEKMLSNKDAIKEKLSAEMEVIENYRKQIVELIQGE